MTALEHDLTSRVLGRLSVVTEDGGDVVDFLRNPNRWGYDLHAAHQRIEHLENRLRITCPDHESCATCGSDRCVPCAVGDPADVWCEHPPARCPDCRGKCPECRDGVMEEGGLS